MTIRRSPEISPRTKVTMKTFCSRLRGCALTEPLGKWTMTGTEVWRAGIPESFATTTIWATDPFIYLQRVCVTFDGSTVSEVVNKIKYENEHLFYSCENMSNSRNIKAIFVLHCVKDRRVKQSCYENGLFKGN